MQIPIFHMASFSRSGETLMLRCLNAHPDIEVVHQIREPDTAEDRALFRNLTDRETRTIAHDDPLVAHRALHAGSVLLLKNAVWTHSHPRRGFTLVRNPFSLVASSYRAAPDPARAKRQKKQQTRWAQGIDPAIVPMMQGDPTLTGFLVLYARKMLQDRRDGLPFLRYEDFVADPEPYLRRIVAHLGLDWNSKVLTSHEDYREGEKGHGGIKLWQPIHEGSARKYDALPEEVKAQTYGITHEVLMRYGYGWDGTDLTRHAVDGML